jgi:hypothetical protein
VSTIPKVTLTQARAFRLQRHHLIEREPARRLGSVLSDINGAQAQLLPAAMLSAWARVGGITRGLLDDLIWRRRSLVRAWCMRRTLYLLPSDDAAVYCRGSSRRAEKEIRWMLSHGAQSEPLERSVNELLEMLDHPMTRREIADGLSRRLHVPVEFRPGGAGWGNRRPEPWIRFGGVSVPASYALHLAGARGVVVSGPSQGGEATYVRGDAWIPSWKDLEVPEAESRLALRYLGSFGPAAPSDFATWAGIRLRDANEIWSRIIDRLVRVELDGQESWALRDDLSILQSATISAPQVRLLPHFDGFLLGHHDHGHIVAKSHHLKVYRNQGWVSPVLLVNGTASGVWRHSMNRGVLRIRIEPLLPLSRAVRSRIAVEGQLLGNFLEAPETQISIG